MSYYIQAGVDVLEGDLGAGNELDPTPMTLVAWIKKTQTEWEDANTCCAFGISGSTTEFWDINDIENTSTSPTVLRARLWDDDGDAYFAGNTVPSELYDKWFCAIATFNTDSLRRIYINDSTDVGEDSNGPRVQTANSYRYIAAGNRPQYDWNHWRGKVAECALFNKVLSTTEIDNLVTGAETGVPPNSVAPNDCVGYWSLKTDQATHADESGNGGPSLSVVSDAPWNSDHPTIVSAGETINRVLKEHAVITDPVPGSQL